MGLCLGLPVQLSPAMFSSSLGTRKRRRWRRRRRGRKEGQAAGGGKGMQSTEAEQILRRLPFVSV